MNCFLFVYVTPKTGSFESAGSTGSVLAQKTKFMTFEIEKGTYQLCKVQKSFFFQVSLIQ
jgi:hypothetical protein